MDILGGVLQIPPVDIDKMSQSEKGLLFGVMFALAAVIVALSIYIKKLHHKQIEREKEAIKVIVDLTREFTSNTHEFKATIDANMKSHDRLIQVVDNMHRSILEALRISPPKRRV